MDVFMFLAIMLGVCALLSINRAVCKIEELLSDALDKAEDE